MPARRLSVAVLVLVTIVWGLATWQSAWASNWQVHLSVSSAGEASAQANPVAPTSVTATCTSSNQTTIKVTWAAVTHATNYTVYQSITSATSGYSAVATVATTSWTSASLANNNYWYEVTATIGTNWTSTTSAATARRTITTGHCA